MYRRVTEHKIGTIFVDAGLCWVGDPCYVLGADTTNAPETWDQVCAELEKQGAYQYTDADGNEILAPGGHPKHLATEVLGRGVGWAISTGIGDGEYPVFIEVEDMGSWGKRVRSIRVEFFEDEDDE